MGIVMSDNCVGYVCVWVCGYCICDIHFCIVIYFQNTHKIDYEEFHISMIMEAGEVDLAKVHLH